MNFKFYHNNIGKTRLESVEMHASLHEIIIETSVLSSENPYIKQLVDFLTQENEISPIIRKHFERGLNIGDEKQTRIIMAPDFPIKRIEPGYFNSKAIENGLFGGDFDIYKANILKEVYYYFWETKHPFSQWHKCNFEVDNIEFTSTEQYMMYRKAILFEDYEIAKKILKTKNVRKHKELGRQVSDFNLEKWQTNSLEIVYKGNKAKFTQNIEFKKLLLSTKGKTIVEASLDDMIWGIGLIETDSRAKSIFEWKGTNFLGIILTELREELLENKLEVGYLNIDELKDKI